MPKTHYFAKINTSREIFGPIVKARKKPLGNFTEVFYEPCCPTVFKLCTLVASDGAAAIVTITGGEYANINWGDGSSSTHVDASSTHTHNYVTAGTYQVKVSVIDTPDDPVTASAITPDCTETLLASEPQSEPEPEEQTEPEQKSKVKHSNGKNKKDKDENQY
jgi:hypothetical protein